MPRPAADFDERMRNDCVAPWMVRSYLMPLGNSYNFMIQQAGYPGLGAQ